MLTKTKILVALLLFFSIHLCTASNKKTYKIAISSVNTSLHQAGRPLAELLEKELGIDIDLVTNTTGSYEDINLLLSGEVDFAIAQNTITFNKLIESDITISTILPIYKQILIIATNQRINNKSFVELIANNKIGMGEKNGGTAAVVQDIFTFYGFDTSMYQTIYHPYGENFLENSEVLCMFTAFNQPQLLQLSKKENIKFIGLDKVENLGIGSSVEGLCKNIWTLEPYILPKFTYGNKPERPILTVSSDAVLLCNTAMSDKLINRITECILEHKSELVQTTPIFNTLSENFDKHKLTFPLHKGSQEYINRDVPTFIERYAEISSLIFSILVVIVGSFASFARWNKQKKKERIDIYYRKNLEIRGKSDEMTNIKDLNTLKYHLEMLRRDAISNLINEKLSADESFSIFIEMNQQAINYIDQKINQL